MGDGKKVLFSISELRPFLFVAGYGCLSDAKLKQYGITHCVNATNIQKAKQIPGITYMDVRVDDNVMAHISDHFDAVCDFIDQAKAQNGRVLIFCAAGVSRSAVLAIMYLVLRENLTLREAYYALNQVRPIISPNIGFWRQMIETEQKLSGKATVELLRGRTPRPVPDVYLHRTLSFNA